VTPRVLIDAGALVSVVDHGQPRSLVCRALVTTLPLPLVTTWAAYTEAMYLLFGIGGWPMQRDLWGYVETGVLQLHAPDETEPSRMMSLMEQYRDCPMDLADATLVAAAETLGTTSFNSGTRCGLRHRPQFADINWKCDELFVVDSQNQCVYPRRYVLSPSKQLFRLAIAEVRALYRAGADVRKFDTRLKRVSSRIDLRTHNVSCGIVIVG